MDRKKVTLVALAMLAFFGGEVAYAEDSKTFSFDTSTTLWSEYLSQGGNVPCTSPVLWTTQFATHNPTGIYVGVFNSIPVDGSRINSNYCTENDGYIGVAGRTGDVGYNFGLGYLDLYPLAGRPGDDLAQVYAEIKFHMIDSGKHKLAPFVRVEFVTPPPGTTSSGLNRSFRGLAGLSYAFEWDKTLRFDGKLWAIGDDGQNFQTTSSQGKKRPEPAFIGQLDVGVHITITPSLSINAGVRLSDPITKTVGRDFQTTPNIGLSWSF